MALYRVFVTDGDTADEAVVNAENEFMAAKYTVLRDGEIVYRVERVVI